MPMTFVTEGVGGSGSATLKFKVPTTVLVGGVLCQGGNGIGVLERAGKAPLLRAQEVGQP